jgi:hypothetical protein
MIETAAAPHDDILLTIWTVYDRPRDFPAHVVVRRRHITAGCDRPSTAALLFPTLAEARAHLAAKQLIRLDRDPADDPAVVEIWI